MMNVSRSPLPKGFTLPYSALQQWESERAPSPHPLTNAAYYPGLTEVACDTVMHRMKSSGDGNLDRLLVSSPLLGPSETMLQMLIKDGSVRANLISLNRGDLQPLDVKAHQGSKTDYEVSLPNGRQLGFHRGLPDSGRLAIWVVQGDTRLQVDFSDSQKHQPEFASVSLESIDEGLLLQKLPSQQYKVSLTQERESVGDREQYFIAQSLMSKMPGIFMTR